ncbi:abl interactor 1-like, partial [Clarias magur]
MKYSNTDEIVKTLEEAPAARKALLDNHSNLYKVADYCENKYSSAGDTAKAVEESKALTTQALASVAYQINTLAASVVKLLDAQAVQLKHVESSVNNLSMTVDMYKEKVARQEIGVLTAPSKIPCVPKIVPPARSGEPKAEYERVPISYASLDSVGHGIWDNTKPVGVCRVIVCMSQSEWLNFHSVFYLKKQCIFKIIFSHQRNSLKLRLLSKSHKKEAIIS